MITEEKHNFKNWTCISSSVRIRLAFESAMHPTRDTLAPLSHPTGYYIKNQLGGWEESFAQQKQLIGLWNVINVVSRLFLKYFQRITEDKIASSLHVLRSASKGKEFLNVHILDVPPKLLQKRCRLLPKLIKIIQININAQHVCRKRR